MQGITRVVSTTAVVGKELLAILLCDGRLDFSMGQAGGNFVSDVYGCGVFQQLSIRIENQGISAIEDGQGRERLEGGLETFGADSMLQKHIARNSDQRHGAA